jgi:hypothetical protein
LVNCGFPPVLHNYTFVQFGLSNSTLSNNMGSKLIVSIGTGFRLSRVWYQIAPSKLNPILGPMFHPLNLILFFFLSFGIAYLFTAVLETIHFVTDYFY